MKEREKSTGNKLIRWRGREPPKNPQESPERSLGRWRASLESPGSGFGRERRMK
jgi:hypothetical protein